MDSHGPATDLLESFRRARRAAESHMRSNEDAGETWNETTITDIILQHARLRHAYLCDARIRRLLEDGSQVEQVVCVLATHMLVGGHILCRLLQVVVRLWVTSALWRLVLDIFSSSALGHATPCHDLRFKIRHVIVRVLQRLR